MSGDQGTATPNYIDDDGEQEVKNMSVDQGNATSNDIDDGGEK